MTMILPRRASLREFQSVLSCDAGETDRCGLDRYHAWESLAMNYLSELSPYKIRTVESSFNRMVRP